MGTLFPQRDQTKPSRTRPSCSVRSTPRSSARPVGGSSSTRKITSRGDRESKEILLGVQRDKERIARVLEACRVQEPSLGRDILFADGNTGEPHATRRHPWPGSRRSSRSPLAGRVGSLAARSGPRRFVPTPAVDQTVGRSRPRAVAGEAGVKAAGGPVGGETPGRNSHPPRARDTRRLRARAQAERASVASRLLRGAKLAAKQFPMRARPAPGCSCSPEACLAASYPTWKSCKRQPLKRVAERLLTTREVAAFLGVSSDTALRP